MAHPRAQGSLAQYSLTALSLNLTWQSGGSDNLVPRIPVG